MRYNRTVPRRSSPRDPSRVRLQPADAFDLIRWLARSQSDPRKAVAELVQNAIDANARTVVVERRRVRGRASLVVRDDGEGIRPQEAREVALRYIATHIGRSHKRNLSPSERHEQIVAGKYGIGLLGFWSIGHRMEIRSRVGGGATWLLRLVEDQPRAEVVAGPTPLTAADTGTEIVVTELHAAAQRPLAVRRLADYLGSELRGPLAASGVTIEVRELDGHGAVKERCPVVPRRYTGARLELPATVDVPGYPPLAIELYVAAAGEPTGIELTCAGTVVADQLGELTAFELDRPPWTGSALVGAVEFASLAVPPGTRRGVIPDDAALAMVAALESLAPRVLAELARLTEARSVVSERQLLVELRRALRGLRDRVPHLDLTGAAQARAGAGTTSDPALGADGSPVTPRDPQNGDTRPPSPEPPLEPDDVPPPTLLPPGPVATIVVSPDPIRLWPGGARRVRAIVTDVHGQRISAPLRWRPILLARSLATGGIVADDLVFIEADGLRATVRLAELSEPGAALAVEVTATAGGGSATALVPILLVDGPVAGAPGSGIPEPVLVDEPGASWRSRVSGTAWQVNVGHPDYRALAADARARLRHLVALFAKDLTVRATHPANEPILDQMITILALAELNLMKAVRG